MFNLKLHDLPWLALHHSLIVFGTLHSKAPLILTERGENFSCVPHFVRTRQEERLRIVMVANPTEGYGIFIENMLNAAETQVMPKAA